MHASQARTYASANACTCVCECVSVRMYTLMWIRMHVCIHVCMCSMYVSIEKWCSLVIPLSVSFPLPPSLSSPLPPTTIHTGLVRQKLVLRYLTAGNVVGRFLTAPWRKRDLFADIDHQLVAAESGGGRGEGGPDHPRPTQECPGPPKTT